MNYQSYKDIPGYPGYRINEDGLVISCRTNGGLAGYDWEIKSQDPIRDLVRAGAIILAELERRLRVEVPK